MAQLGAKVTLQDTQKGGELQNNDDEAEIVAAAEEDRVLAILHNARALKSPSDDEYHSRLLTFQARTYYAKPACLSPLFCARFGWRNADTDMLSCSSCSAVLAILPLPSMLSTSSLDKLCTAYRRQIVSSHSEECPFRLSTSQFERMERKEQESKVTLVVPSYMASVLPEESIQLMEHPAPRKLLRKRVQEITEILPTIEENSERGSSSSHTSSLWKYPKLTIPEDLRQFAAADIGDINEGHSVLATNDESIVGLAVLGWKPIDKLMNTVPVITFACPLCMSLMDLELESTQVGTASTANDDDEENEIDRPTKRPRQLARFCNPLEAHRHYCPYKCGIPRSIIDSRHPVWKVILDRLSREKENDSKKVTNGDDPVSEEALDQSIKRVRQILRASIVTKTLDLS